MELGSSHEFDHMMNILAVYKEILLSKEYKIMYFIKTETGKSDFYDDPNDIPKEFMNQGNIQLYLMKA